MSVRARHDDATAHPYGRRTPHRRRHVSNVTSPALTARQELQDFQGQLIGPDDGAYEDARAVYNAMIDRRPAVIARVAGPADVAGAIRFARDHDLALAVRGGGHNGAGLGTVDD